MLSVATYDPAHVERVRARVAADVAVFRAAGAPAALEPAFCTAQLLALDRSFVHRARGQEGKDGNPLNEVRVLCDGLVDHDGVVTVPKGIRLAPERTVLGLGPGDRIALDATGLERLAGAFLAEIGARYA